MPASAEPNSLDEDRSSQPHPRPSPPSPPTLPAHTPMPIAMYSYSSKDFVTTQAVRPKRRQVKNACTNCQKACKKCDDARPCMRCVKYGYYEYCVSSVRKERQKGVKRGPYKKRDGKGPNIQDTTPVASAPYNATAMSLESRPVALPAGYPTTYFEMATATVAKPSSQPPSVYQPTHALFPHLYPQPDPSAMSTPYPAHSYYQHTVYPATPQHQYVLSSTGAHHYTSLAGSSSYKQQPSVPYDPQPDPVYHHHAHHHHC